MSFAAASDEGYAGAGGVAGQIETGGGDGGNAPVSTSAANNDSLPFTGAELGVLTAAGSILVLLGFGLRRMTHGPSRV